MEVDLGNALAVVDSSLTQLSRTPVQFRTCVEDVAQQIAGVVAAVQAHDITRQQIEHVQEGFALISAKMRGGWELGEGSRSGTSSRLRRPYDPDLSTANHQGNRSQLGISNQDVHGRHPEGKRIRSGRDRPRGP